jgi:DNA-binding winged helix-turn-helix (wHTH) protein
MDPISAGSAGRTNMPIHFSFADFEFEAKTGTLKRDGKSIAIGSRAVMILRTLIERRDECVSNAELLAAGWPNVQVEEANVRVHIAALRKALGDHEVSSRTPLAAATSSSGL